MNLSCLKQKLVWQMTGEELSELIKYELQNGTQNLNSSSQSASKSIEQKYIYGLKGIAKLFGCSVSKVQPYQYVHPTSVRSYRKVNHNKQNLLNYLVYYS